MEGYLKDRKSCDKWGTGPIWMVLVCQNAFDSASASCAANPGGKLNESLPISGLRFLDAEPERSEKISGFRWHHCASRRRNQIFAGLWRENCHLTHWFHRCSKVHFRLCGEWGSVFVLWDWEILAATDFRVSEGPAEAAKVERVVGWAGWVQDVGNLCKPGGMCGGDRFTELVQ